MTGIIITAIICATVIIVAFINRNKDETGPSATVYTYDKDGNVQEVKHEQKV